MRKVLRTGVGGIAIDTRERSCALLLHCLDQGIRPARAWLPIPLLLPGERTSTLVEPAKSIFASLWVGYVWADEPRSSAAVVVTGTDTAAVAAAAERVARRYWDARERFAYPRLRRPMYPLDAEISEPELRAKVFS